MRGPFLFPFFDEFFEWCVGRRSADLVHEFSYFGYFFVNEFCCVFSVFPFQVFCFSFSLCECDFQPIM